MPPFNPHVDVSLILGSVVAAYLIWSRRHERDTGETTTPHVRHLFLWGMAVLFIGSVWPLHDLAERVWYTAHMIQHLLFTLVAAPMLVAGIPAWMWRKMLSPRWVARIWQKLTRPLVATLIFNGVLLFAHWPAIVDAAVVDEPLHFLMHVVLVGSAIIMWWPIMSPLPELPPLTPPVQMLYLFIQGLVPMIPASFLTFSHRPLYLVYETFPRVFGISVLTDQLVAGLSMKLLGTMIFWGFTTVIFFRWERRERVEGWDALALRDVEADLRAGAQR
ncbi:MAG TPA: cytochrome c oxidase assembly protein [Actinomycetota bacterium]|nr:cytochrome c oxidase assembly protein [Actinomycetota bacterium]